ncbi:MAG: FAD-dependent 5-carboxymethylaminomethyl-2-thiouridine(34) oxidoreductase MnmC [Burkholderiales bacterium]|nr:FAD-dependent 5-carboxymethylaminomethyl-2-thiouridine(34) oxidoreductase MnmC [Burkholderiales bacterium]
MTQSHHPLLAGNRLPGRWMGRDSFVILQVGFGLGHNFLDTWAAWKADPKRCQRLVFIAIEPHPLPRQTLQQVQADHGENPSSDHPRLAQRLVDAWPVQVPGLHTLNFEEGPASGVTLLLCFGELTELMPQIVAQIDAFFLDDSRLQSQPPLLDKELLSRLSRIAAPGASAVACSSTPGVLDGLSLAGFVVDPVPGLAGHPDLLTARFEPRHRPSPLPGGLWPNMPAPERRHALIIGAGLAGCATAWALARQGWRCTLIDAHQAPAQAGSGNPSGAFHSIVHGEDGIHARTHRAAALHTANLIAPWVQQGRLAGACDGMMRLDTKTSTDEALALVQHLNLPTDYARWLDQAEAAQASGIGLPHGGWLFPQGGWLDPAGYAQLLLDEARRHSDIQCLWEQSVQHLHKQGSEDAPLWGALDDQGRTIAEAPVVVLANAQGAVELMRSVAQAAKLPLSGSRGQITTVPLESTPGCRAPRIPVSGAGYVLPAHRGRLLCGATSQRDDADPAMREDDHWHNLKHAMHLGCLPEVTQLPHALEGRVGWRASTPDRMPYVGAWPLAQAIEPAGRTTGAPGTKSTRVDQPRFVPRLRDEHGGVYVNAGLGSRGIIWAALGSELLASWITGCPCPVEAALRDALDPARILTRAIAKESGRSTQADASA